MVERKETLGTLVVKYASDFTSFLDDSKKIRSNLSGTEQLIVKNEASVRKFGLAMGAFGTATLAGIGLAVREYAKFDTAIRNANSVIQVQGQAFEEVRAKAREWGRDTVFNAAQSANAIYKLGSAGLSTNEIFDAGPEIINLAIATMSDFDSVAETTTIAIKALGLEFADTPRVTNAFAGAIQGSNLNMERLSQAMITASPVASAFGQSLEGTLVTLQAFADRGVMGSKAGIAYSQALIGMNAQNEKLQGTLSNVGLEFADIDPRFMSTRQIIETLQEANFSAADAFEALGRRGGRALASLLTVGSDEWDKYELAVVRAGNTQRAVEQQMQTLSSQLTLLKSAVSDVAITIGTELGEGLEDFTRDVAVPAVRWVGRFASAHESLVGELVTGAAGFGAIAIAGGGYLVVLPQIIKSVAALELASGALGVRLTKLPLLLGKIGLVGVAAFAGWKIGKLIAEIPPVGDAIRGVSDELIRLQTQGVTKTGKVLDEFIAQRKALQLEMKDLDGDDLLAAEDKFEKLTTITDSFVKRSFDQQVLLGNDVLAIEAELTKKVGLEVAARATDSLRLQKEFQAALMVLQEQAHDDFIKTEEGFQDILDTAEREHDAAEIDAIERHNRTLEGIENGVRDKKTQRDRELWINLREIREEFVEEQLQIEKDYADDILDIRNDLTEDIRDNQNSLHESLEKANRSHKDRMNDIEVGAGDSIKDAKLRLTRKLEDLARARHASLSGTASGNREARNKAEQRFNEREASAKLDFNRRIEDIEISNQRKRRDALASHHERRRDLEIKANLQEVKLKEEFAEVLREKEAGLLESQAKARLAFEDDKEKAIAKALKAEEKIRFDADLRIENQTKQHRDKIASIDQEMFDAQEVAIDSFVAFEQKHIQSLGEIQAKYEEAKSMASENALAMGAAARKIRESAEGDYQEAARFVVNSNFAMISSIRELEPTVKAMAPNSWFPDAMTMMANSARQGFENASDSISRGVRDITTDIDTQRNVFSNAFGSGRGWYGNAMEQFRNTTHRTLDSVIYKWQNAAEEVYYALRSIDNSLNRAFRNSWYIDDLDTMKRATDIQLDATATSWEQTGQRIVNAASRFQQIGTDGVDMMGGFGARSQSIDMQPSTPSMIASAPMTNSTMNTSTTATDNSTINHISISVSVPVGATGGDSAGQQGGGTSFDPSAIGAQVVEEITRGLNNITRELNRRAGR